MGGAKGPSDISAGVATPSWNLIATVMWDRKQRSRRKEAIERRERTD